MYLIKEITDKTIWEKFESWICYKIRKAARAIVIDKKWRIPLLYAQKDNYYKLPGWWVEDWEDIKQALQREFIEEVWAKILIEKELWFTIEIKNQHKKIQFSYIYIWKIKEIVWEPKFTQEEKQVWLKLCWFKEDEILDKLKSSNPKTYLWKMIKARDIEIFEYFLLKTKNIKQ